MRNLLRLFKKNIIFILSIKNTKYIKLFYNYEKKSITFYLTILKVDCVLKKY